MSTFDALDEARIVRVGDKNGRELVPAVESDGVVTDGDSETLMLTSPNGARVSVDVAWIQEVISPGRFGHVYTVVLSSHANASRIAAMMRGVGGATEGAKPA
jgi:hypothetical protein